MAKLKVPKRVMEEFDSVNGQRVQRTRPREMAEESLEGEEANG